MEPSEFPIDDKSPDTFTTYLDDDSDFEELSDDEDDDMQETEPEEGVEGTKEEEDMETTMIEKPTSDTVNVEDFGEQDGLEPQRGGSTIVETMSSDDITEGTRSEDSSETVDREYRDIGITGIAGDTWASFLYYLYTGQVVFAPLSSEKDDARSTFRAQYKQKHPKRPSPCSCKSMYRLASELNHEGLKDLSLKHLRWQLNPRTIIAEVFSKFTSKYEAVKDMELSYLVSHWDKIKDSQEFQNKMQDITSGQYPHAYTTLTEIFRRLSAKSP